MVSSLIVLVATIDSIAPHPGADRLEIAQVLGWQAVVPKGRHRPGDRVVYFPPDAIVPKEHSDRFGVTQYLASGRVECARLCGVPSYGFLFAAETADPVGTNLAMHYGVTKYEPPIRSFAGDALCANVSETAVRFLFRVEGAGQIQDDQAEDDRSRAEPDIGRAETNGAQSNETVERPRRHGGSLRERGGSSRGTR